MIGEFAPYFLKMGIAGGIVAADETSVGQVMISRPIAAGFVSGLLAGNLELGVLMGALFELLYIDVLPIGSAAFPSAGLAAVSAVAVCGFMGWQDLAGVGGFLPFLVLLSALAAGVGGRAVASVRRTNERLTGKAAEAVREGRLGLMQGAHLAGIPLSFLRGFTVVFHVLLAVLFLRGIIGTPAFPAGPAPGVLAAPLAALGVAIVLKSFLNRRRIFLFVLGAAVTGAVLLLSGL